MFFFYNEMVLENTENMTNLEYIKICGLFGRNNVELQFDKVVNLYIGENGLGKTTILNCVYFLLTKRFDKLSEIKFDKIIVKFRPNKQPYIISSADIKAYNAQAVPMYYKANYKSDEIRRIIKEVLEKYIVDNNDVLFDPYDNSIDYISRKVSGYTDLPISVSQKIIMDFIKTGEINSFIDNYGDTNKVKAFIKAIENNISQKVLYLPTYRRIESDFSSLFMDENRYMKNEMLIKFGMSDVERSIEAILEKIKEISRDGFNKMTGVLLKQYAYYDTQGKTRKTYQKIDKEMLKIILDRLGNEIAENDYRKIFDLLENEQIYTEEYSYLYNLILNLMKNYDTQKVYDEKIKAFVDTCNKYLSGKQFVYNQSEVKLDIQMYTNDNEFQIIKLSNLSSGEKQIVSLFSKLFLENNKESILIIDEPELSISMKWQRMLVPDIIRSDNCKLLLTVTHSPFIFENEFDDYAQDIRNCITDFKRG